MHHHISKSRNAAPGDLRIPLFQGIGKVLGRFRKRVEVAQNGVLGLRGTRPCRSGCIAGSDRGIHGCVSSRGDRLSQAYSLLQQILADAFMKGVRRNNLDPTAKQFFQVGDQSAWEKGCRCGTDLDQEVEITPGAGLASRNRAKNTDAPDPMAPGDPENLVAIRLDQTFHVHTAFLAGRSPERDPWIGPHKGGAGRPHPSSRAGRHGESPVARWSPRPCLSISSAYFSITDPMKDGLPRQHLTVPIPGGLEVLLPCTGSLEDLGGVVAAADEGTGGDAGEA